MIELIDIRGENRAGTSTKSARNHSCSDDGWSAPPPAAMACAAAAISSCASAPASPRAATGCGTRRIGIPSIARRQDCGAPNRHQPRLLDRQPRCAHDPHSSAALSRGRHSGERALAVGVCESSDAKSEPGELVVNDWAATIIMQQIILIATNNCATEKLSVQRLRPTIPSLPRVVVCICLIVSI